MFFYVFFCLTPVSLECSRNRKIVSFLVSHRLINAKVCIHGASRMEWKRGKCWKLPIFEGKFLRVFISYMSGMKIVCSITLHYSSTFYSLFRPFFFWRYLNSSIKRFRQTFVRHSASISKFEWFEQLWILNQLDILLPW